MQKSNSFSQKPSVKKSEADLRRERMNSYAEKRRKFGAKSFTEQPAKPLSSQELKDMANRKKAEVSQYGKDVHEKQQQLKEEVEHIKKASQTKSFIHGVQERRKREQEDLFINQ